MKTKEVRELVGREVDTLSQRDGVFTAKKSYYWGITSNGDAFANKILALVPNSKMVDRGNHWAPFHGGARAGSPQDSYFYVKFTIEV